MNTSSVTKPSVGVGAVVIKENTVLMIKRGKPPRAGHWSLPGGGQELGETVFEGAVREIKEETGVDIEVLGLIDVIDSISRKDSVVTHHYTIVDVLARWTGGQAVAGDDAMDAAWFSLRECQELDIWSETWRIIRLGFEMMESLETRSRA